MFSAILRSPDLQPIALWDESQHPRDKEGQFAQTGSMVVGDRTIQVVKPKRAMRDRLVPLDVDAFDQQFKADPSFYLSEGGGKNAIGTRYARFGQFIAENTSIEAAEVYVGQDGRVGFTNGRHRYAWLRDQGIKTIPVAMTRESVRYAKQYGYLSAQKWDESQHPRDAEGQFTAKPVAITEYLAGHKGMEMVSVKELEQFRTEDRRVEPKSSMNITEPTETLLPRLTQELRSGEAIQEPLTIAYDTEAGRALLLDGNTRLAAIADAGFTHAPVVISRQNLYGFGRAVKKFSNAEAGMDPSVGVLSWLLPSKVGFSTLPRIAQKGEHTYGSTHIMIDPWSSAATSLNVARNAIFDEDRAGNGKDVDPNHITVRYGLLNENLNQLRSFIAAQAPFMATIQGIELFPATEHSDGAVPVVARIEAPELHAIEAAIDDYADFKDKNFPGYKPHSTIAYVTEASAPRYATLPVGGTCLVHSLTISHQSGVQETIPFGMVQKKEWDPSKHPRNPGGSSSGGEFTEVLHGAKDALDSLLNDERATIDPADLRNLLKQAREMRPTPNEANLMHLHLDGMRVFDQDGLGIKRDEMPQIPKEHREQFLKEMRDAGVEIVKEWVDPLTLKPSQDEISARNVGEKIQKYKKGDRAFPPLLVSSENRLLDGHHHWGMITALAVEAPEAGIKVPIYRLKIRTKFALALMHAYDKKYNIQRKSVSAKKDPKTGRYVTPFVSFDKQGDDQLRMIASLNSSRLATWGFTAEAEVRGLARYKLTAVLDGRTSQFCRMIDGTIFNVADARRKVIEVLNVQDPEDLRVVQPWPKQTKAAMAEYKKMSPQDFTDRGLHIPPFHPYCRTILRPLKSSEGELTETTPTIPAESQVFQPVTQADLLELGVEATPEDVAQWNEYIGMTPTELLSKLSGMPPQEVLTKGKGLGSNPIQFVEDGAIGIRANGSTNGLEFKLKALLDPFTSTFYLTQADLEAGNPKAEVAFLKNLFKSIIEIGGKSSATAVALAVTGSQAAYYTKLGFLPDDIEWDSIRLTALTEIETGALQPVLASLSEADRLLVIQLLQDKSVTALSALVDLPFTYQGKSIGEWILVDATGTWGLDLLDDAVLAQAKEYLS